MAVIFLYCSIIVVMILFFITVYFRKPKIEHIIIGFTSIGYSIAFDTLLGTYSGLYYYISPISSPLYIVLSGVLMYPLLNILYTLFLPEKRKDVLIYTSAWIAGMLLFEYASLLTKTIVFTGWRPIPWSIITYMITYTLIYQLYKYLKCKLRLSTSFMFVIYN